MPALESEESTRKDQEEQGLKMLSRLPFTLAQLKVGNNSEKLKNEIRELFYD